MNRATAAARPEKKKYAPKRPRIPKLRKDARSRGTDKPPTDRQERFALEYLTDFDRLRALRAAGYEFKSDRDGHSMASYILGLPNVALLVLRKKAEIAEKLEITAESLLNYMKAVFMEAMADRDWGAALVALREIGRVYGIYERDNIQKRRELTFEDVDRLKAELSTRGFDFSRKHFPPELVGVRPGDPPRLLSPDATVIDSGSSERHNEFGRPGTTSTSNDFSDRANSVGHEPR